jgi:hypothetical protein
MQARPQDSPAALLSHASVYDNPPPPSSSHTDNHESIKPTPMNESLTQNQPPSEVKASPSRMPHPPLSLKVPLDEADSGELGDHISPRQRSSKLSPLSPVHSMSSSPAALRYLTSQTSMNRGPTEDRAGYSRNRSQQHSRYMRVDSMSSDGGAFTSSPSSSQQGSFASPGLSPLVVSQPLSRASPSMYSKWESIGRPTKSPTSVAHSQVATRSLLPLESANSYDVSSSPFSLHSNDPSSLTKDGHRIVSTVPSQPVKIAGSLSPHQSYRLRMEKGAQDRISTGGGVGSFPRGLGGTYQRPRIASESGLLTTSSLELSSALPRMKLKGSSFTDEATSLNEEGERTSLPHLLRPTQQALQAQRFQSGGETGDAGKRSLPTIQPQIDLGGAVETGRSSGGGWSNARRTRTEGGWRG